VWDRMGMGKEKKKRKDLAPLADIRRNWEKERKVSQPQLFRKAGRTQSAIPGRKTEETEAPFSSSQEIGRTTATSRRMCDRGGGGGEEGGREG